MTNRESKINYFLSTYSQFSHNYLLATLTANDADFETIYLQNEETYSKFVVWSDQPTYKVIRELVEENNGTAISIEYGPY